jgi:predicted nuclease of restriction endonuclease-like (RecB) superfamily
MSISFRNVRCEMRDAFTLPQSFIPKKSTDSVVSELAIYIQQNEPDLKGFSDKNIWRMKQFYESYRDYPKLSPLVREISWSHNLAIFTRCKSVEEREFYLKLAKREHFGFRELDRQISASLFERTMLGKSKLSTVLRETQDINHTFKDSYKPKPLAHYGLRV